eukprot:11820.XXX_652981_653148_1 [CDS] Oithona nana genome sequencing.
MPTEGKLLLANFKFGISSQFESIIASLMPSSSISDSNCKISTFFNWFPFESSPPAT